MAQGPTITILKPSSPEATRWDIEMKPITPNFLSDIPDQCYLFVSTTEDDNTVGWSRAAAIAHFDVPVFVNNRMCFEINGFFGSRTSYDDGSSQITSDGVTSQTGSCGNKHGQQRRNLKSCSTWFRCLVKMVRKVKDPHETGLEYVPEKAKNEYVWFEMTIVTRWQQPNKCQVMCFNTPPGIEDELQRLLVTREPLDFRDPFAMHACLVDQIIVYYDISVWRVRDPVRQLEKSRMEMRMGAIFDPIHEISRHAIHTREILEVTAETLSEMQRCRKVVHSRLPVDLGETYRQQADEYATFQITMLKSLKLRSDSSLERLKNEVTLAFNLLARQDNTVMKSIALLTMIFLPATFISAFFSTTFFRYSDDGEWRVSEKMWIYWVTTVPATIFIVVIWRFWIAESDDIMSFAGKRYEWIKRSPRWMVDYIHRTRKSKGKGKGEDVKEKGKVLQP